MLLRRERYSTPTLLVSANLLEEPGPRHPGPLLWVSERGESSLLEPPPSPAPRAGSGWGQDPRQAGAQKPKARALGVGPYLEMAVWLNLIEEL